MAIDAGACPPALPVRRPLGIAAAWPALVAIASVAGWAAWAAVLNQAQFGDNIEQFNWSHSLEWGYAKHPPFPTWLMGAAVALFGRQPALGYAMAALCFAATAAFTWDIARRLLGARAAAAALLLWTLQFSFSWRAQLYNHNTALVACVAAAAWCVLRALDGSRLWWPAAGAAAAAAMLSKYQALVPLAGLLLALGWTGRLRERRHLAGVALAVAMMLLLFMPHLVWLVRNDFTTLRYAATSVEGEAASASHALRSVLSFAANQLRTLSLLLLAALAHALWQRWRPSFAGVAPQGGLEGAGLARRVRPLSSPADGSPQAGADDRDRAAARWLAGLIWAPALLLTASALAGVSLRNHWGVQMFQFASLWIAWRWQRSKPIDLRRLACIVAVLHAALLAGYAVEHRGNLRAPDERGRRHDTLYPARGLARVVAAEWRAAVGEAACPLRYVAGDAYLAGLAALYGGEGAVVHGDAVATPWVDAAALARAGHAAVVARREDVPAGAARVTAYVLAAAGRPEVGKTIHVAVVPPAAPCR